MSVNRRKILLGHGTWLSIFLPSLVLMATAGSTPAQAKNAKSAKDKVAVVGWWIALPGGQVPTPAVQTSGNSYANRSPIPYSSLLFSIAVGLSCNDGSCSTSKQYRIYQTSGPAGAGLGGKSLDTSILSVQTNHNATIIVTASALLCATGQYQFAGVVDPNNLVHEEAGPLADNVATLTVNVDAPPGSTGSACPFTYSDKVAVRGWTLSQDGKSVPLAASGTNYSASSALAVAPKVLAVGLQCNVAACASVQYRIHQTAGPGTFDTGILSAGVIGPGTNGGEGAITSSPAVTWTPNASGQYAFAAEIDPNNLTGETGDAAHFDNIETLTLTVAAPSSGGTPPSQTTAATLQGTKLHPAESSNSNSSSTTGADLASLRAGQTLSKPTVTLPCCTITAVNTSTGVVTAKVNATGQVFIFTLANRTALTKLRTGQSLFANFGAKQISLDGKSPAGTIVVTVGASR